MTATIFSIANQKGGVGKTTTAVNLSASLARKGIPTLLIDLDPQGNTTSGLGLEKEKGGSLYDVLHGEANAIDRVKEMKQKNLSVIPAEMDLAAIEVELSQKGDYLMRLRQCLAPIKNSDRFRAIILDCPPALGLISMNSLACADKLIVTLQCEYLALEGLSQILSVVEDLQTRGINPSLEVGGILMTMFDIRTNLSRQISDDVQKHFPKLVFETTIPRSTRLSEAPSFGQSIFDYDRMSSGAKAYERFGEEVIHRFGLEK
ncbi:MAG: ParA family protein [Puniceicoccales bacterium]|jgi:chromosome partitioning protein|nr:ParA family protein [Puniceicoccales bacterium]